MIIWIPLTIFSLILIGLFLSFQKTTQIPVFINGLIPSLPNAKSIEDSGTTVYIVYIDEDSSQKEKEIFRGFADGYGRVKALISAKNVGRRVLIRYRHRAYVSAEFETTIPSYGIIQTVKMEKDGKYNGKIRGKEIPDLKQHHEEALVFAEFQRKKYIRTSSRTLGHPFARIRVEFWLFSYMALIFAFALDYWSNAADFNGPLGTFVQALYFSVVTITTLGYGESYPITDELRIACSMEAFLGVFIVGFALNSLLFREPEE